MKIIFFGTANISKYFLENISDKHKVVSVVTMCDKPVGRSNKIKAPAIKEYAIKQNIPYIQVDKFNNDIIQKIKDYNADVGVVVSFGKIIPKEVFSSPRYGCFNIHFSLLPKYRGAAPVQQALIDGNTKTGVTAFCIEEGLDTGDIIKEESTIININDNMETLSNKLSLLGAKMIIEELPKIINGTNNRIPQDNNKASYVGLIKREDEHLDFNTNAINIYNKVRALAPSPLANFILDDVEYKISKCEIDNINGNIGEIIAEDKTSFTIGCLDKAIKVTEIKPIGKKIMSVQDFKNGYHDKLVGKVVK